MLKAIYKNGVLGVILRVTLLDSTVAYRKGLVGLAFNSAGLNIGTIADNEASATGYKSASSKIESIGTLGTFAEPTATKCRFREVDPTVCPGLYEIQLADARWAVSGARVLRISLNGATNLADYDADVQLGFVAGTLTPSTISGLAEVTTTGPVISSQMLEVVRGDDYLNADGRALAFASSVWPSLSGGQVRLSIFDADTQTTPIANSGGVVDSATAIHFDLSAAQTAQLVSIGKRYYFDIKATLANTHVVTLTRGVVNVLQSFTT